ncbi:hypothetical protein M673_12330 [Aureimonas sp. AU20]|nr:hypothetical protein M673_12330 [Aureimonas sp. AU20]
MFTAHFCASPPEPTLKAPFSSRSLVTHLYERWRRGTIERHEGA